MAPKAPKYEMAVGLKKGHRTTKIVMGKSKADKKHKIRPSRLKGVSYICICIVIQNVLYYFSCSILF